MGPRPAGGAGIVIGIAKALAGFILYALPMAALRFALMWIGLIVVLLALPFARQGIAPITQQYPGWKYKRLPTWAWLWDNDTYGTMGNKHWTKESYNPFFYENPTGFWSQWYWLALRNPVNNMEQWAMSSVDLREASKIEYLGAKEIDNNIAGWQFVWCTRGWKVYSGLYVMLPWFKTGRCLELRLGFKLKPSDNDEVRDRRVGLAVIINPFKGFRW